MDEKSDLDVLIKAAVAYRHDLSCPATMPMDGDCTCSAGAKNKRLQQAIMNLQFEQFKKMVDKK